MLNEILNAATVRVGQLLGEGTAVYKAFPGEAAQKPYALAGFSEISEKQMVGQRFLRRNKLRVRYQTDMTSESGMTAAYEAMDLLLEGMRTLTLEDGSLIRGTGLCCKEADGALDFCAEYQMFLTDIPEAEDNSMDSAAITGALREKQ